MECFGRGLPRQCLSRTRIDREGDGGQIRCAMRAEIRAFREVLPQQAVRVFVGAALPRTAGIAEEDRHVGRDGEGRMLGHLGFGFAEIGSISADLSHGNPKPRLFRLPEDRAIVVYYGLQNDGAEVIARRLKAAGKCAVPLGVNIVKTNRGANAPDETYEQTVDDYVRSVRQVAPCADYLALNLSCPNAKGGKDLFADPANIGGLLARIATEGVRVPVFLKVIPNPDPAFLEGIIAQAMPHAFVRGFIFNLPPGKPPWLQLQTPKSVWSAMPGAVAGAPVSELMNTCIRECYQRMPRGRFQIIGGGGIFTAEDAYHKIGLGASAVQIYTAMVYDGPRAVRQINEGLLRLLRRDGHTHIADAVGSAHVSGKTTSE